MFWGKCCSDLGVGPKEVIVFRSISEENLASQVEEALNPKIIENAKVVGQKMLKENGVYKAKKLMEKLFEWMSPKEPFDDNWGKDDNSSHCPKCAKEFSILFRRHHCRACGLVACSDCLLKKHLFNYRREEQYVCEVCSSKLQHDGKVDCLYIDDEDGRGMLDI